MSDIAIRVENLSKLYRIGRAQSHGDSLRSQRHDTLRDAISDFRLRIADLTKRNPTSLRCGDNCPKSENFWALKEVFHKDMPSL